MQQAGITPAIRPVVDQANRLEEETGEPAMAIQLPDGQDGHRQDLRADGLLRRRPAQRSEVPGRAGGPWRASDRPVRHPAHPDCQGPVSGSNNPRLHSDEVLIAWPPPPIWTPKAPGAGGPGPSSGLSGHCSVILSPADEGTYRKLGIQLTCEPKYQTNKLYHR